MENTQKNLTKNRSGEMSTGTQKTIKAIGIKLTYYNMSADGFEVLYENLKTKHFDLEYMNRFEDDFEEEEEEEEEVCFTSQDLDKKYARQEKMDEFEKELDKQMKKIKLSHRELREESKVNGRYTDSPKCECCKKSAGDNYYSHPECNNNGKFLHLCKKCAIKYADTSMEEMLILFPQEEEEEEEEVSSPKTTKLVNDDVMNRVFQQNEHNAWQDLFTELEEAFHVSRDELNKPKYRPLFEKIECWAWHDHQLRCELNDHEPKGVFWNSKGSILEEEEEEVSSPQTTKLVEEHENHFDTYNDGIEGNDCYDDEFVHINHKGQRYTFDVGLVSESKIDSVIKKYRNFVDKCTKN